MKKWIATLLSLALLLALALPAMAEQKTYTLEGFVTELVEGGFVMEDTEMGQVLLNTDDATVWDGLLADEALAVGQYVFVTYDGKLTRSVPPQAHADKVGCYVLNGVAGEFLQDGVLLTGDETFGDVIVRLDSSRWHVFEGVPMTVYYDGVMALSLPGQVNASAILLPELYGTVADKDESGFTLTTEDEKRYRVELDENSLMGEVLQSEPLSDDDEVKLIIEDEETDDQTTLAGGDWSIDLENAEDEEPLPSLTLADVNVGDEVKVYFSGEYLSDEEDAVLALETLIYRPYP